MIGKLIKAFAIIILIACVGLSLIYGIQILDQIDETAGLVVILTGCVSGIFTFAMLFGYGHLIDTNAEMNKKMDKLIIALRQANTQSPQSTPYTAPVPPAPVAPVASVAPVAPVMAQQPTIIIPPVAPVETTVPNMPTSNPFDDTVVLPTDPQSLTEEASGWTCSKCGAQHTNLTAFCKFCGNQRV